MSTSIPRLRSWKWSRPLLALTALTCTGSCGAAAGPERRAVAAVLANTWGAGSRSAEMVLLPKVLVDACLGDGGER